MIKTVSTPAPPIKIDGIGNFNAQINYTGGISISTDTGTAITLVQKTVLAMIGFYNDPLKLFSTSFDIVGGKAVFMNLVASSFGIRPANGCNWNPQAKAWVDSDGVKVNGLSYQFEQCYDEFLGACLRKLLGKGNSIQDILATEEGMTLFEDAVAALYISLINDLDVMAWVCNHPLIGSASINGSSQMDDDEWNRFYAQNYGSDRPTGWLAVLDNARSSGIPNLNGHISPNDALGGYSGDAIAELRKTKANSSSRLRTAVSKNAALGVYFVSRAFYTRLTTQLGDSCCNDSLLKAKLLGSNPDIGWNKEYILWEGHYVVPVDIFDMLDTATGTHSVRVIFTILGNLAAGFDVPAIQGSPGIAFEAEQRLGPGPGFMGKVYGQAQFEAGFGILDRTLVSYSKFETA